MAAAALSTTAFLLTTLVPKLHGQSVLPTTFVNSRNQHLPVSSEVAIAPAGPFVSLVQRVVCLRLAQRGFRAGTGRSLVKFYEKAPACLVLTQNSKALLTMWPEGLF